MADEIFDNIDVVREFLGERQRVADEARDALAQGVIEALDMIGFPGVLRDGFMPFRRNHPGIGIVLIRMEYGPLTVRFRNLRPQALGTSATAIKSRR